jgi:hypothetical protein
VELALDIVHRAYVPDQGAVVYHRRVGVIGR